MTCFGCRSALGLHALPLASISVFDGPGGTPMGSQTTDSAGNISLAAGTYWLEESSGRFDGLSITVFPGFNPAQFVAASGYLCGTLGPGGGCIWPIAKTLTFTDSRLGSCTLVYSTLTGTYSGVLSFSYGGTTCGTCTHGTVNVKIETASLFGVVTMSWDAEAFPSGCPFIGGMVFGTVSTSIGGGAGPSGASCFVPGTSAASFMTSGNTGLCSTGSGPGYLAYLYGGFNLSVTQTTTE